MTNTEILTFSPAGPKSQNNYFWPRGAKVTKKMTLAPQGQSHKKYDFWHHGAEVTKKGDFGQSHLFSWLRPLGAFSQLFFLSTLGGTAQRRIACKHLNTIRIAVPHSAGQNH